VADAGVLGVIAGRTRERVARLKKERPLSTLRSSSLYARSPSSLAQTLSGAVPRVIAEVKFASPSEGVLRSGASAEEASRLCGSYLAAGAAAVSILTEPEFFGGSHDFLQEARAGNPGACLLMKDFFLDAYQFELARACGADAILLIAAMLGDQLGELHAAARAAGLSILVEVHDEAEAEAALALGVDVLGVNSRNLRTLKTDLGVAKRLASLAKRAPAAVAESGLRSRAEAEGLAALGYRGFLIGTSFMKTDDPGAALAAFLLK
jgi:indole-3-glycerol phosphate synthase